MSEGKSAASRSGIGVLGLLGVAFIVLKLCNVIDWEWYLVLLPFWGPLALAILILLIVFVAMVVISMAGGNIKFRR